MSADLTTDNDDLYQVEPAVLPLTPIPVYIEGPVQVQDPPACQLIVTQVFVDSTAGFIQPQRVLGEDPRRKIARIVSSDQKIRVGRSQKQVMSPDTCAVWPVGVPLEIAARSEVWIAADTATTRVSVVAELWAV